MAALNTITRPVVASLAVLAMAFPAYAGDFSFAFSFAKGGHRHGPVAVGGRVIVAPAPAIVVQPPPRVWIPPVYRTVVERVWVPTVTTAYRNVPRVDCFGRIVGYRGEAYTIRSGYWREVSRQVLVQAGYWTVAGPAPVCERYPGNAPPAPAQDCDTGEYQE